MKRFMFGVISFVVFSVGVSPAQVNGQSVVPEKVHKALKNIIGIWDVEVTQGSKAEKAMKGRWINKWDASKQYVISTGTFDLGGRQFTDTAMISWDGISQDGTIFFRVGPRGNHVINRLNVVSETISEGESTGVRNGKEFSAKMRTVVENSDKRVVTIYWINPKGETIIAWKGVYTRVK
jgi:hypothetical protein